jgi:hypothetical protein
VKRQRNSFSEGKITLDRIDLLDMLDFVWNRLDHSWKTKYDELVEFQKKFGTCAVSTTSGDRALAEWTQRQRKTYDTKDPSMTFERITTLEQIPSWSWEIGHSGSRKSVIS